MRTTDEPARDAGMHTATQLRVLAVAALLAVAGCGGAAEDVAAEDGSASQQTEPATAATAEQTCADVDLAAAPDQPVTIRMGNGVAAEEPLWLVEAAPDVAVHQGSWYELELQPFRGNEDRLNAYQAGELDAASTSPQALIRAAVQDVAITPVSVMLREGEEGYNSTFIALEDSGITSMEDLAGKTIAIVDIGSHLDFLAKGAVAEGGADFATGAEYVVLPFPAQEEALRGGQIDVAGLPEPFYSSAHANGGVVDVFSALDVTGFPFDVLTIAFQPSFIDEHLGAVCAFLEDFRATTNYYRENQEEGRKLVHEAEFVPIPLDVYLQTQDYARPQDGAIDLEGMRNLIDGMVEFDVLQDDQRIDPEKLIRPGVSIVADT